MERKIIAGVSFVFHGLVLSLLVYGTLSNDTLPAVCEVRPYPADTVLLMFVALCLSLACAYFVLARTNQEAS